MFLRDCNLSVQQKLCLQKDSLKHLMGSYQSKAFHFNNVYWWSRKAMDLEMIPDMEIAKTII